MSSSPSSELIWRINLDWDLPSDLTPASGPVVYTHDLCVFGNSIVALQVRRKSSSDLSFGLSELTPDLGNGVLECGGSIILCTYPEKKWEVGKPIKSSRLPMSFDCYRSTGSISDTDLLRASIRFDFSRPERPSRLAPTIDSGLLLGDTDFSDVVVVAGDRTFHCHKVVLALRSDVFRTMLLSKFKEAEENRIEIQGFTPDITEQLLKFIYTDQAPAAEVLSWELFDLAKMYDVVFLQRACLVGLVNKLAVDSVCQMLERAHFHELPNLFATAKSFFKTNIAELKKTDYDGYKRVLDNEELVDKLLAD